ncbi:DUF6350 family protein [Rhodoluna sp.]|uniref:cell division protein PerM n=1 Tax=Rhodoluna sp. TaxID=1969481 RepID=UPI0025DFA0B8|nr:DUF6350 family protein [Rhodoluna sp.]
MNRRLTFLISAFETLIIAAIGVGLTLAPLTIVWLFENDATINWLVPFRASADIWLMAHGTRLMIPAGSLLGTDFPQFVISMIPLAFSALIAFMAFKLGRRLTTASDLWIGWLGSGLVYAAISFLLSTAAYTKGVYPINWQGTFFPPVFFLFFVILGSLIGKQVALGDAIGLPEPRERIAFRNFLGRRFDNLHWAVRATLIPALRAGTAVTAILVGTSAILVAVMMALNWVQMTRLYEGLHVSVLGGIMVTVGQLAILPNLIIFGASWLTGVGFSIGTGSLISPLGTVVAPLPALPITAALPQGEMQFALAAVLVPMVGAFIATIAIRRHADQIRFEFASAWGAAFSLGIAIGLVAALQIGILAGLASGGIGPERLQQVGINAGLLMLVVFAEVTLVATLAAFYSARPDKADHPLLAGRRG